MGYKQYYTKKGNQIEIRIKDESYNTLYKARANIFDHKNLAMILEHIEMVYGVKISEAIELMMNKERKEEWFDST